ncbi:hypothetical protein ACFWDI_25110 [Streptomyces sp. NPDC060064]|uniref:hypothetical protein n=1 Tax=Streptomyces sp. NPDC060064 TaxID=3347049 RepID=UPI0036895BCB
MRHLLSPYRRRGIPAVTALDARAQASPDDVKDNRLHYVYNFLGSEEQRISATEVPLDDYGR